jgi:3-deoxy-manno-octulosonate cytidylyltransferase (CMP-KDO synthetase)
MNEFNNKKVLGVIPARIGSTRIPEKMLADICGKPLIQWTIERTQKAKLLDALVVSTDSEKIADVARSLGVRVFVETFNEANGTERVAATVKLFSDFEPDIIVNVWGDEPLYPAEAIDACIAELVDDEDLNVALAGDRITDESMLNEPSIVQALTDINNNVLCFSRAHVPYPYTQIAYDHYHVIGVMAMRKEFMNKFLSLPKTPIELREGVEQMRILEHGYKMKLVKGDYQNLGVNTPDELEQVREIMKTRIGGIDANT